MNILLGLLCFLLGIYFLIDSIRVLKSSNPPDKYSLKNFLFAEYLGASIGLFFLSFMFLFVL
jgi:hypothetical protein